VTDINVFRREQRIIVDSPSRTVRLISVLSDGTSGGGDAFCNVVIADSPSDLNARFPIVPNGTVGVTITDPRLFIHDNGTWRLYKGPIHRFATIAERDSLWLTPKLGDMCYVEATLSWYIYASNAWRIWMITWSATNLATSFRSLNNEDAAVNIGPTSGTNPPTNFGVFCSPVAGQRHTGSDLFMRLGRASSGIAGWESMDFATFAKAILVNAVASGAWSHQQLLMVRSSTQDFVGIGYGVNGSGATFRYTSNPSARFEARADPGTGFIPIRASAFQTTGTTDEEKRHLNKIAPGVYDESDGSFDLGEVVKKLTSLVSKLTDRITELEGRLA
jgi:hypothetical protein